jgi:hypothetical protein
MPQIPQKAEEIEVTPEMVEAAFCIFASSGAADEPQEADKLLIEEMYRAMSARRRQP